MDEETKASRDKIICDPNTKGQITVTCVDYIDSVVLILQ